jgi:uncharacterized protein (DUF427 family)
MQRARRLGAQGGARGAGITDEDDQPSRYYFPRSDVKMDKLERSSTTTEMPVQGHRQLVTPQPAQGA